MSGNLGCVWWARNRSKRFETKEVTQIDLIVLKEDNLLLKTHFTDTLNTSTVDYILTRVDQVACRKHITIN